MNGSKFPTLSSKNSKKDENLVCYGCDEALDEDHLGIRCAQDHHLCSKCSKNMVLLFLADPKTNLPPKCMMCKVALNPSVFERQLSPEQHDIYTKIMLSLLWYKDCLKENEQLVHCAFCAYTEIRDKTSGMQFMFCQHEDCQKVSCLVCHLNVPKLTEDYDEEEEESYQNNMQEIEKHFICAELAEPKKIFEEAIEKGQKMCCPDCGLAGMKDEACTHMTCPDCQTVWCYVCGLAESNCDKDFDGDGLDEEATSIYQHNADWPINPKRCPMYLTEIQEIDNDWPDDDQACLERFHRIRTLRYIHEAYKKIGPDFIDRLDKQFGIIGSCGFTLDEIRQGPPQLIDYDNHD